MPSLALRWATVMPRICEVMRLEMARPAASSLALLTRRPEDRRSIAVCRELLVLARLFWALRDIILVFTTLAMMVSFLGRSLHIQFSGYFPCTLCSGRKRQYLSFILLVCKGKRVVLAERRKGNKKSPRLRALWEGQGPDGCGD